MEAEWYVNDPKMHDLADKMTEAAIRELREWWGPSLIIPDQGELRADVFKFVLEVRRLYEEKISRLARS